MAYQDVLNQINAMRFTDEGISADQRNAPGFVAGQMRAGEVNPSAASNLINLGYQDIMRRDSENRQLGGPALTQEKYDYVQGLINNLSPYKFDALAGTLQGLSGQVPQQNQVNVSSASKLNPMAQVDLSDLESQWMNRRYDHLTGDKNSQTMGSLARTSFDGYNRFPNNEQVNSAALQAIDQERGPKKSGFQRFLGTGGLAFGLLGAGALAAPLLGAGAATGVSAGGLTAGVGGAGAAGGGGFLGGLGSSFAGKAALSGAIKGGIGGLLSGGDFSSALKGAALGGVSGGLGSAIGSGLGLTGAGLDAFAGGLTGASGGLAQGDMRGAALGAALGAGSGYLQGGGRIPGLGSIGETMSPGEFGPPQQGTGILGSLSRGASSIGSGGGSSLGGGDMFGGNNLLGSALKAGGALYNQGRVEDENDEIRRMLMGAASQQDQYLRDAQGMFNPYQQSGLQANNQLSQALAAGFNPSDLATDPSYQFRLQQGEQALARQMSAQGMGQSGAALKAAQQYGQGLAAEQYQQSYNNWLNQNQQLAGQAGMGFDATSNQAGLAQALGQSQAMQGGIQAQIMARNSENRERTLAELLGVGGNLLGLGSIF